MKAQVVMYHVCKIIREVRAKGPLNKLIIEIDALKIYYLNYQPVLQLSHDTFSSHTICAIM